MQVSITSYNFHHLELLTATMAHGLTVPPKHLMHPPEPLSGPQVQDAIQTTTPPPSPKRQETDDTVDYPHWGLLKPLNVDAPFTDWFFSRQKTVYKIGASKTEMDIVIVEPVMSMFPAKWCKESSLTNVLQTFTSVQSNGTVLMTLGPFVLLTFPIPP